MHDARLILMCGLPGSGKTTLARQLAADRGAVRLSKDEWLWALGATPWDEATQQQVERELWRLAQEILRLGLSVVVDFGLWARSERDEMRSAARDLGVGVELHHLDVPVDVLWRRIDARNARPPWNRHPIRRADLDRWVPRFQAPDAAELSQFEPPPPRSAAPGQRNPVSITGSSSSITSGRAGPHDRDDADVAGAGGSSLDRIGTLAQMSEAFDPVTRGFTDSAELRSLLGPYGHDGGGIITFSDMPASVAAALLELMPAWNRELEAEVPPPAELVTIANEIDGSLLGGHVVLSDRRDERVSITSITVPGADAARLRERLGWWADAAFDPDAAFEPGEVPDAARRQPDDDLTLWWD